MSETTDKFTKEEQDHLSYLGSMLSRPNDEEEQFIEDTLRGDAKAKAKQQAAKSHLPKKP
jgi:hypothetical protein